MDPVTISFAAALISAILVKTGEKFAEKAGEGLLESSKEMYGALKDALGRDQAGELTLLRLHDEPDETVRRTTLTELITKTSSEDPEFAESLQKLVSKAQKIENSGVFITGDRNVTVTQSTTGAISTGDTQVFSGMPSKPE